MSDGGKYMTGSTYWPENKFGYDSIKHGDARKKVLKTLGGEETEKEVEEMNDRIKKVGDDKIEMTVTVKNDPDNFGEYQLCRMLQADKAFSLLYSISEKCRRIDREFSENYTEKSEKLLIQRGILLQDFEEIWGDILESGLMEIWR